MEKLPLTSKETKELCAPTEEKAVIIGVKDNIKEILEKQRKNKKKLRKKKRNSGDKTTKFHIIPKAEGGTDHTDNINYVMWKPHQFRHGIFENKLPAEVILQVLDMTRSSLNEKFALQLETLIKGKTKEELYKKHCYKN